MGRVAEEEGVAIDKTPPPWKRRRSKSAFRAHEHSDFHEALSEFMHALEAGRAARRRCAGFDTARPGNRWNGLINAVSTYISGGEL